MDRRLSIGTLTAGRYEADNRVCMQEANHKAQLSCATTAQQLVYQPRLLPHQFRGGSFFSSEAFPLRPCQWLPRPSRPTENFKIPYMA